MEESNTNYLVLAIYILGQLLGIIIAIIYGLSNPGIVDDLAAKTMATSIITLITYIAVTTAFIYYLKTYLVFQFQNFKKELLLHIIFAFSAFMALILASYLANVIMTYLDKTDIEANQAALEEMANGTTTLKVILVLITLIGAPFIEELTFRKGLFGVMDKLPVVVPIIASGLLFGLIHVIGDDIANIIPYALAGVALSIVYVLSNKNIWVVIFGHAAFNFVGLLPLFIDLT